MVKYVVLSTFLNTRFLVTKGYLQITEITTSCMNSEGVKYLLIYVVIKREMYVSLKINGDP